MPISVPVIGCLAAVSALCAAAPLKTDARSRLLKAYDVLPLTFEPNLGQVKDSRVRFLSQGKGYTALFGPSGVTLAAEGVGPLRLGLAGANGKPDIDAAAPQPGHSNYLIGNRPSAYIRNVPHYGKVRYRGVYPGIDLVFYGTQGKLEFDFVIAPGADPRRIRMRFEGQDRLRLDPDGDLVLESGGRVLRQKKPVVYQRRGGRREPVEGRYVLRGKHEVAFEVAGYDARRPLIVDPVIAFATYSGTSQNESVTGIAADTEGNAYITGTTYATGQGDVFVTKLNASGTSVLYTTHFGGASTDYGYGIAVDSTGNAYVAGTTYSSDFPLKNPLYPNATNAFLTKLNSTGDDMVYSTYFGAVSGYRLNAVAVNSLNQAYVAGVNGNSAAFVAELADTGASVLYNIS